MIETYEIIQKLRRHKKKLISKYIYDRISMTWISMI